MKGDYNATRSCNYPYFTRLGDVLYFRVPAVLFVPPSLLVSDV